MRTRHLQSSFAGGEVSPAMYSRINDSRYATGVARMRNFIARAEGPAVRRPGFVFVREAVYETQATYPSRLIPFKAGPTDSLVLELADQIIRFHTGGQTLLYARTRMVQSVDPATDRITFVAPHQFAHGDAVRLLGAFAAVTPGGTDQVTTYYVRQISSTVIELSLAAGPGGVLDLTTAGSGELAVIPLADFIGISRPSAQINTVDTGINNWMDTIVGHELQTDDPIHFTSTGALPSYSNFGGGTLTAGVTYYAIRVDATFFRVALTPGGGAVDLSTSGSGTQVVYRKLPQGTVYSYPGLGAYYTRVEYETAPHGLPITGEYQLPTNYLTADLDGITYRQSGGTITFTHFNRDRYELTRVSASQWVFYIRSYYGATVAPPTLNAITREFGEVHSLLCGAASPWLVPVDGPAPSLTQVATTLQPGDFIYCESQTLSVGNGLAVHAGMPAGVYLISDFDTTVSAGPLISWFKARDPTTTVYVNNAGAIARAYARRVTLGSESTETYVVTSVTDTGSESVASAPQTAVLNWLSVPGASNTVSWSAATGATRYRIYKKQSGIYGLIGETDALSFKDEDFPPNLSRTPPYVDTTITVPGVVSAFEQRAIYAATLTQSQTMWFGRPETESTLTYHLPIEDTDRIRFTLNGPESGRIRHVVPLTNLLVFTDAAEFVVTPVNSDAITPTSFRARAVTTVGCSTRTPLVTSLGVLFEAARGAHIHQFIRSGDGGYQNDDISVRASHLFDGKAMTGSTLMRAPDEIGWWCASDGQVRGVTYNPKEGVLGWHVHDCYGTIESVCCVPEGVEDALYLSVWDGSKRHILRMREFDHSQPQWEAGVLVDSGQIDAASGVYLDNSKVVDWRNRVASWSMTLSASPTWKAGTPCNITSSSPIFIYGMENDGGVVRLVAPNGYALECTVSSVTNSTFATVVPTADVPTYMRTAVFDWRLKFKVFRGFTHLNGNTVAIMADGAEVVPQVVTNGTITLTTAASVVCVGRNYISRLETLPLALRVDESAAQGRTKNINRVWIDCLDVVQLQTGTVTSLDEGTLKYYPSTIASSVIPRAKIDANLVGEWDDEGRLVVQTLGPWPLTVSAVGMEVSLGP